MRKLLLLTVFVLLLCITSAYGATTSNLAVLGVLEDSFYNYDFDSQQASSDNVDWPVTMVFWKNAEVDKVKNIFFGVTIFAWTKNEKLNDGNGWVWDEDRGTKKSDWYSSYLKCYVKLHMRIYAPNPPDYMNNSGWGKYVIATTHYDENSILEQWSGYSEYAEKDFAQIAASKGYAVAEDWAYFYNYEPYDATRDPGHIWLNNGYATAVMVE